MMVSAVNRSKQAAQLQIAHDRTKTWLDSAPFICHLWGRDLKIFDCNEANIKLLKLSNKREILDHFYDFSPEYQDDGQPSREKAVELVKKAFDEGRCVSEWTAQLLDGTPIPLEITFVRVPYKDDYIVATYSRDLRQYKKMINEIERRDNLLHTVNSAAATLLAPADNNDFEASLLEGMKLIGQCLDVDCIHIWQNETIDGEFYFANKYRWFSEYGRKAIHIRLNLEIPIKLKPVWESKFLRGEYMNGPFSTLPPEAQEFLSPFGFKSVVIIPLFLQNQFWGFFSLGDCRKERIFTKAEIDILRSGNLMIISALNLNIQAAQLREAHRHTQVMLNAMPLSCHLWHRDGTLFDCNDEAVKVFKAKNKQDYIARYPEFSPEYQSDGQLSSEKSLVLLKKAFDEGRCTSEWMHQMPDGTPLPSEKTLVRVNFENEPVVAIYTRDLREHKKMMREIERRDFLSHTTNKAAEVLLQSEIGAFDKDLCHVMAMVA
jgi:PAS domain-containing protein